jgi:SAM-dependent methyltransferase
MNKVLPFDSSSALRINQARQDSLALFLPSLKTSLSLTTAVDVACGVGYFSKFLATLGFEVTGLEYREDNVATARERHPDIQFRQFDVEADIPFDAMRYDLTLCTGLLYHLENPFRAVRNLRRLTGKVAVIESMLIPTAEPLVAVVEEGEGADQGVNYMALIPSLSGLALMLYRAGFLHVYRVTRLPDHEEFREMRVYKQRRDILVASMVRLDTKHLTLVPKPSGAAPWTRKWGWRMEEVRWFLRKPIKEKAASIRRRVRKLFKAN